MDWGTAVKSANPSDYDPWLIVFLIQLLWADTMFHRPLFELEERKHVRLILSSALTTINKHSNSPIANMTHPSNVFTSSEVQSHPLPCTVPDKEMKKFLSW